ncbi:hypothetical protein B9Z55_013207 [Caenorhabditis nigoni]|uniref:Sdz-33 F-box domain-containing protein n=2 Tax=Caenorhabditis nigoni TaxID=1611254 RepID=A0A2G5U0Y0_9PELO|nr:hypothetical protein B9Z55_013207 [Caenorhabditis nigoni]
MKMRNAYLEKRNELYECGDSIERMRISWIRIWSDFLCQTFNCALHSICIHPEHCIGSVSSVINWLNTRQESIENLIISGEEIVDDDLSLALSTSKVNHYLGISTRTADEIKPLHPTIKTDYIRLVGVPSVSWISIDDIITFDCVHIDLSYFKFDEMGLNRYLKAWINGCNRRLEYLKSYFYFVNLEEALHDIEKENGPPPKRFYTHDYLCLPFDAEGGITIRRNNGDLATIKLEFNRTPYSIPRIQYFFTFVVWNSS